MRSKATTIIFLAYFIINISKLTSAAFSKYPFDLPPPIDTTTLEPNNTNPILNPKPTVQSANIILPSTNTTPTYTEIEPEEEEEDDDDETYKDYDYNGTNEDQIRKFIHPKTWTWVLIVMNVVVFLVGMIGNVLVCVAVYRNHSMRTVTNYFIVNLAVADFLVILCCLPPTVIWDVTMTWFFGTTMCKVVLYLQSVSVTVSVLTLTFISIDRWYAICFPLKFKSTTGRAKTAIAIIWMLALALDIPEAISRRTVHLVNDSTIYFTTCQPSWSRETDTIFLMTRMTLLYVIPLLFMTIAYIQIISVLWKSGSSSSQTLDVCDNHMNMFAMNTNASTEGQLRSRRKAAKMLVSVVVMFAVCLFPVQLLDVLRAITELKNTETNRAISMVAHWLCYANSAINPIIYNFMSGKFRKEFRRAFEHCCQREPFVSAGGSASEHPLRVLCSNGSGKATNASISRTLSRSWKTQSTTRTSSLQLDEAKKEMLAGSKKGVVPAEV